jgi:hypothetical protein
VSQAEHFFNDNFFAIACEQRAIPYVATAARLTCLCAAHLHDWSSWFLCAEIFVKRDDAMYFRNRDIKYVCENRNQVFADISGVVLYCVKCRQHATLNASKLADDGFKFWERCVSSQGS